MKLTSQSLTNGEAVPAEFAFAVPDAVNHVALSTDRNPHLAWSDAPEGTASFVVVCHDPDAPTSTEDVNVEGRQVPADLPRANFYHWLLFDIPAHTNNIEAGSHSDGVTPTGKSGPAAPGGLRHGLNSYTDWFAGDPDMRGNYFGYDGPCPPWNDSLIHHYIFTVYALSTPQLTVSEPYDGTAVEAALAAASAAGQVLASASISGTYTLNPALRK